MKKKFYFLIFFIILFSIIYLNSKSYRYVGNNYIIEKIKISNFQKLSEFYKRHLNYQKLVKKITKNSKNKSTEIIDISTWVYKNIKKISDNDDVIDNHPYTIVERNLGTPDQFSDLLSVLLVYINIDSFFTNNSDINDKNKPHRKFNPVKTLKNIMDDELNHADDSEATLVAIQKDELVHHGMAKKFYESKFPNSKLKIAFKREKMKNRFRLFYYKNAKFLNKIFDPILNLLINCFGRIVNLIKIPKVLKQNLMSSNSKSVV